MIRRRANTVLGSLTRTSGPHGGRSLHPTFSDRLLNSISRTSLQGCTGGPIGTRSINAHKSTEGDGAVRETIVASLQLAEAALVKAGLPAPRTAHVISRCSTRKPRKRLSPP